MDPDALVKEVIAELQPEIKNRKVEWTLENLPCISGDKAESRMAAPPVERVAVPMRSAENQPAGPDTPPDDTA